MYDRLPFLFCSLAQMESSAAAASRAACWCVNVRQPLLSSGATHRRFVGGSSGSNGRLVRPRADGDRPRESAIETL